MTEKPSFFLAFNPSLPLLCNQFIYKIEMLSRKAEGFDPMKP